VFVPSLLEEMMSSEALSDIPCDNRFFLTLSMQPELKFCILIMGGVSLKLLLIDPSLVKLGFISRGLTIEGSILES